MADSIMRLGLVLSAQDKLSRVLDGVTNKFKKLDQAGKNVQKSGAYLFAAGAAVTGVLAKNFNDVAEKAKTLRLETQKIGMNKEAFEVFAGMAKKTNVATDALTASIARMEKAEFKAATGSQEQINTFKRLGISIRDSNGKLKSSEVMLNALADKFSAAPDGVIKTAMAMSIFGKTGKDMIPLLNKGSKGLNEYGDELKRTGNILTEGQIAAFAKYTEQMGHTKTAITGLKTQMAVALLPAATDLANKINEISSKVSNWVAKNQELTASIVGWTAKIGAGLMALGAFNMVVGTVIRTVSTLKKIQAAFSLVMKSQIITTKIATVNQWLLNSAIGMGLLPIIGIIAAIAAVVAITVICWQKFAKFRAVIKTTWETVKEFGTILKDYVVDRITGILSGLGSIGKAIGLLFKGKFSAAFDEAKKGVKALSGYDAKMKAVTRTKTLLGNVSSTYNTILAKENANQAKSEAKSTQAVQSVSASNYEAQSTSSSAFNYAPVINMGSGSAANKEEFRKMLHDHAEYMEQIMIRINNKNKRLSYQ